VERSGTLGSKKRGVALKERKNLAAEGHYESLGISIAAAIVYRLGIRLCRSFGAVCILI
jgi:hypothetical protein